MKTLFIKGRDDSPEVTLDKENKIFSFSGKSLPEDVGNFYAPILEWFGEYSEDPLEMTTIDIKLLYFNTATSKLILDIFMLLEEMKESGNKVSINWHYPEYDEEMKEAGIEYSEMVELDFNLIEYPA